MVDAARKALYPMERARNTSPQYLKRFCMRGSGPYDGHLLVSKDLRANVSFEQANLMQPLPDIGKFDVVDRKSVV